MDRRKLLLGARSTMLAVVLAVLFAAPAAALESDTCTDFDRFTGICPRPPTSTGEISNGGVDVTAGYDDTSGGGSAGSESGDESSGEESGNGGGAGTGTDTPPLTIVRDDYTINCEPGTPCDPNLVVRISDLVNFRSALPSLAMEPSGWAVIGLPVNFFATASVNVKSGSLLGYPAEVRFSPVGYRWDYGDGHSSRSAGGGSSWAAQGLPEFSATATSHVYESRGVMLVTLSVEYAAEYRFATQSWREVQGTLAVSAAPLSAVTGDAKTVLVRQECTRNPRGPGC